MSTPLRVAVVSRHGLVRAGLTHLLDLDPTRAQVVTSQDGAADLPDHDVAIYDLAGRDAHTPGLRQLFDATSKPIVVITPAVVDADAQATLQQRGVAGLVSMNVTVEALLARLETAARRRPRSSTEPRRRQPPPAHATAGLTDREAAILEQIASGKSNEQIAAEMYLSINTVKTNIRTAYKRMGVTSRSQAVIWAIQHGLVDTGEPDLSSTG